MNTLDVAKAYYKNGLTPLAIIPNTKRPKGTDDRGAGWNSLSYNSEADIEAAFRAPCGIGIRLKDNEVVIDIDAVNIANMHGADILRLHNIDTTRNVIGRRKKLIGAVFVETDDISSIDNGAWILGTKPLIELLTSGKQKLVPPSIVDDSDEFVFRSQQKLLVELQHIPCKQLKEAADMIAAASLLETYKAEEGGRDTAMHCLARLLKNSKHDFIDENYAHTYLETINQLSDYNIKKKWIKIYNEAHEIYDFDKQLKTYFKQMPDEAIAILKNCLKLEAVAEEKEVDNEWDINDAALVPTKLSALREEDIAARDWIIKGLVERGTMSLISGLGGTAKSSFLITLAYLATQPRAKMCDMFSVKKPVKTLYLSNEDSEDELRRRFAAIRRGIRENDKVNGALQYDADKVDFVSLLAKPMILASEDGHKLKLNRSAIAALQHIILKGEYDLVMLDPIVAFHTINENDNGGMSYFVRNAIIKAVCQECNVGVLGAAHGSKNSSNNDDDLEANTAANRGASAVADAARVVFRLANMSLKTAKGLYGAKAPPEVMAKRHQYSQLASGKINNARAKDGSWFKKEVVKFPGRGQENIEAIVMINDPTITKLAEDSAKLQYKEMKERQIEIFHTLSDMEWKWEEEEQYISLMDAANFLMEKNPDYHLKLSRDSKKAANKTNVPTDFRVPATSVASHLEATFKTAYRHPVHEDKEFQFVNIKLGVGNHVRWLKMKDYTDPDKFVQKEEECPF